MSFQELKAVFNSLYKHVDACTFPTVPLKQQLLAKHYSLLATFNLKKKKKNPVLTQETFYTLVSNECCRVAQLGH